MIFDIPVRVVEEENAVINSASAFRSMGKHALIVTGRHSAVSCGALKDVEEALLKEGIGHTVFDGVEENPSVETVMKGRDTGLSCGADFVIGIGGGSPMDAAKAIAFMMGYPDKGSSYLYEKGPDERTLPIVEIPTTCGTGSEVTWVSVLTRHEIGKKGSIPHRLYPKAALVDYRYIVKAPVTVIKNTAVDALAHLVESYVNAGATEFSRMFAEEGMRIFKGVCHVLLRGLTGEKKWGLNEEEAHLLMHASVLAGMSITHTGTSLPHGLSYTVTLKLNMPHGKACGYFLADYLREAPEDVRNRVLSLIGFKDCDEMKSFIWRVCDIEKAPEEVIKNAVDMVTEIPSKLKSIPFEYDTDCIYRIAGIK